MQYTGIHFLGNELISFVVETFLQQKIIVGKIWDVVAKSVFFFFFFLRGTIFPTSTYSDGNYIFVAKKYKIVVISFMKTIERRIIKFRRLKALLAMTLNYRR